MDAWICSFFAFVVLAAAFLLHHGADALKLRSKRAVFRTTKVRSSPYDDFGDNSPYYLRPDLRCHSCFLSVHGNECLHLRNLSKVEAKVCNMLENNCVVHKLLTNGRLTTFTRDCTEKCVPGCRKAGVNYVIEECRTCCTENFCNDGSGAERRTASSLLQVTSLGLILTVCSHIWSLKI